MGNKNCGCGWAGDGCFYDFESDMDAKFCPFYRESFTVIARAMKECTRVEKIEEGSGPDQRTILAAFEFASWRRN